jgi:Hexameric tyrosine-coordinated heme protein (HTHP)
MNELELVPNNSLMTATPEEGRHLAVKMARLTVKLTQPDTQIREAIRPGYADDAGLLIAVAQVVATEFATIAVANDHWRTRSKLEASA